MASGYKFEWKNKSVYKWIQVTCVALMLVIFVNIFCYLTLMCEVEKMLTDMGNIRSQTQHLIMLELFGLANDEEITKVDNDVKRIEAMMLENKWPSEFNNMQVLSRISKEWINLKLYLNNFQIDKNGTLELVQINEVYSKTIVNATEEVFKYRTDIINNLTNSIFLSVALFVILIIVSLPQSINEIQLIRKNRELEVAAYIDQITGLPSRRSCEEKIWTPINPSRSPYCVIIFDLNNLKKVNDEYGHHEGDRLIKGFAAILETISNDRIFAGRYGGDEFILVVHGYNEEGIHKILKKIEVKVENHNVINQHPRIYYAAGYSFDGTTLREMVDLADERMYVNKKTMKEEETPTVKMSADFINL